ncbi:K02A2.6-like [Cordylochernes scorpioides]|uniref:RNA-directed DNA polymerase n=1 Tax=Cordylochernes scorpioides TaxID=51811 RepID=A0ABY6K6V4_9ARAC|nr:K02A2.6-like [Cordylochernes scorpioides]
MNNLPPPSAFTIDQNDPNKWPKWRKKFENYIIASDLNSKTIQQQRAILLHIIGDSALEIYNTFGFEENAQSPTLKDILDKYDQYFRPFKNTIYKRYIFFTCEQKLNQTFDDFVTEIKNNNTISLAKGFIYWPGMNKEIEELINNCSICQQTSRANLKEPLLPHQAPEYPWQKVGIDIFQIESSKYLLIVDYFSKYPEIYQLQDMTSDTIIRRLKRTFSNFGIPETLVSDNGPPFFSKEFQNFTRTWNIVHVTSSPYNSQKIDKERCGEESTDPYLALLNLRNTPHNNLPSPAQILMSRKLRSIIPSKTSQFVPSMINNEAIQKQLVDNQVKMKNYYDRHTRPADPFSINDRVWFRKDKRWIPGQLKNQANEPRSFYVKDQEGNEYRRNSIHIREDKRSETTHTDWEKPLELNQEQADLQDLEETTSQPTSSGQLSSPGSPENVTTTGPPESCTNGSPGNLITTRSGWPLHKKNLPSNLKPYWEFKEELHEWQNLICRGNKLLIPKTQRSDILKILHASHQSINNTIALAKGFIYWPGMNKEIGELINNCSICQQTSRANLKEPLLPHQAPEYPWQKVGIDIFQIESSKYLLIVDYFSKYPEIYQLQDMTTDTIIRRLKRTISNFGIPETLVSDNGPPFFSKDFQNFTRTWNIVHVTSSPYHAQSNGMVERTVQTLKKLIKRCGEESTDPYLALLNLRNTPHNNLPSPAQILMSRKLRSIIPSKTSQFVPSMINNEAIQKQLVDNQVKMKNYYDRHTRPADPLSINDRVWFRKDKRWIPGQLKNQANEPRSFYVKDQEGNEYRRNRIHIREDKRSETTHTDWEKPLELNQEQADLQDLEETTSQPTSSGQLSSPGSPENVTTTGPPESCTNGSPGNLITTRSGRVVRPPRRLNL